IESLNNNLTSDWVLKSLSSSFLFYSDNSLPEFETFSDHTEETSSSSTTTHADNSLSEYDLFLLEIEPDQGELSNFAMEAILGEPHVYVPNVLPTHPTLFQDLEFSSSDDSLGSSLEVSFPFGTRNKIFDPGIFIEVQSERLLSREEFSISFICNPLYPMSDSLLPFSSKNEDKVFKPGILSYVLVSHRDKTTSDFSENSMMMYGGDIPLLDIDSLLEEFTGELAHIDLILPGIDETDSDPKDDIRFIEKLLYDYTSSEDDSFEDSDYVEASPPDSELVSLKEVTDEILHAKLLNIHLLIDKIESLNNNLTSDWVLKSLSSSFLFYSDNSLPEFETFSDHTEETSSSSTTTHADNSLSEYDLFLLEIEPDQGELSNFAMEAILGEPHVYVPNVLPTHPTLFQDLEFSSSDDSLGS
nr:hypothetical protein [Tanacetum cinerariifolium]